MSPDYLLILATCACALVTLATVIVYDGLVASLRAERDALLVEREELLNDNDLFSELLNEALGRHPAKGPALRRIK